MRGAPGESIFPGKRPPAFTDLVDFKKSVKGYLSLLLLDFLRVSEFLGNRSATAHQLAVLPRC